MKQIKRLLPAAGFNRLKPGKWTRLSRYKKIGEGGREKKRTKEIFTDSKG